MAISYFPQHKQKGTISNFSTWKAIVTMNVPSFLPTTARTKTKSVTTALRPPPLAAAVTTVVA